MKIITAQNSESVRRRREDGYSLVELLTVLVVVGIMAGFSLAYLNPNRKAYDTDDQALKIIDLMQKARQFSLTKRRTMRVEFNTFRKAVRLIDENEPDTVDDDREIDAVPLLPESRVIINRRPTNVSNPPPGFSNAEDAVFSGSLHPLSAGENTFTLRYRRNGQVHDQGSNALGSNSNPRRATIYLFPPVQGSTTEASSPVMVKAITILSATGAILYWGHEAGNTGGVSNSGWNDTATRRSV